MDPSTAVISSPCPSTPHVFDGPPGQQIRIGVYISGSDTFNVFDVTLLADHSILKPAGVDLSGTVLAGYKIQLECLQGIPLVGSICSGTDTVDTLHLVAFSSTYTTPPTTGLLFTAIYTISGANPPSSPISVGFQSGCSSTSFGNLCVTIQDNNIADSETLEGGTFDNSASANMPYVSLTSNQTIFGPEFPGVSNGANITATAHNGYPGTAPDSVTFTAQASSGPTPTFSGANPCPTGGTHCSVILSLSETSAGNYTITVSGIYSTVGVPGNYSTLVSSIGLLVVVTDFSFSVSPLTVSFISGEIGTTTATLSSLNGFVGSITLSNAIAPAALTIKYNPNPVVLKKGATVTSTITFKASPPAATTYLAEVKATFGSHFKTSALIHVMVSAPVPDFYFVAMPTTLGPANVGASSNATITVTYVNGFGGSVALSLPSTLPTGLSASLNQTSVNATHNVTLTMSASVAANYNTAVTGTSGSIVHSITIGLIAVDFNLTATPNPITVDQGLFATSVITLGAFNGFGASVSLTTTASTGLSASLSSLSLSGSQTDVLNVTASASIAAGAYTVNVTGVNGLLSHFVQVNVTVLANEFSVSASPSNPSALPKQKVTSTLTFSSINGFRGTIALTLQTPSGVSAVLDMNSVALSIGGTAVAHLALNATNIGIYLVNVTAVSGSLTHTAHLNFTVSTNDFAIAASPTAPPPVLPSDLTKVTITVTDQGTFSGNVTLSLSMPSSGLTASFSTSTIKGAGMATLTLSAREAGNYSVAVKGTGTGPSGPLVHTTSTINLQVQNFTMTAATSVLKVVATASIPDAITITSSNHFSGLVTLVLSSSLGLTASILPGSVTGSGTSTLTVSAAVAFNYEVNVTASSGSFTQKISIIVAVTDFEITTTAGFINVSEGFSVLVPLSLSSANGFAGQVSFSAQVVPPSGSIITLPTVSFSPPTLTLSEGGTGTVNANVTVGDLVLSNLFLINVTASNNGRMQFVAIHLTVPPPKFSITSSPASVVVGPGGSGVATITVSSQGGLFGWVNLTATVPTGLSCSQPSNVRLKPGQSNTTSLSCSGQPGSYAVTISGVGTTPYGANVGPITGSAGFLVADFSLSSTPMGILVDTDQQGHAVIFISWTGNYNGDVTLTLQAPSGLTASLSSMTVTGRGTSNVTVVSSVANVYSLVVSATSGSSTHTITITVTVQSVSNVAPNILGLDPGVFYSIVGVLVLAVIGGIVFLLRKKPARKPSRK